MPSGVEEARLRELINSAHIRRVGFKIWLHVSYHHRVRRHERLQTGCLLSGLKRIGSSPARREKCIPGEGYPCIIELKQPYVPPFEFPTFKGTSAHEKDPIPPLALKPRIDATNDARLLAELMALREREALERGAWMAANHLDPAKEFSG